MRLARGREILGGMIPADLDLFHCAVPGIVRHAPEPPILGHETFACSGMDNTVQQPSLRELRSDRRRLRKQTVKI